MKLNVEISGLNETINALENEVNKVSNSSKKFLEEVEKVGKAEAQMRLDVSELDGNDKPIISSQLNDNQVEIIASGSDVAFIEFGTGISKQEHPLQYAIKGIDPHGQYGWGMGANKDGWWYSTHTKGKDGKTIMQHTFGIDAQRFMYDTAKNLEKKLGKILKEVLE